MGDAKAVRKGNQVMLDKWQGRYERASAAYETVEKQFDKRDSLYIGSDDTRPIVEYDTKPDGTRKKTPHIRNIVAENIESMVASTIPQPQVKAKTEGDEQLAKEAEDMLRNELDRLPMERYNDLMERIVPIQGGGYWLIEWDNSKRTHDTVGAVTITPLHPNQVVPQDGVYTGVDDMDYIFVRMPQTKSSIEQKYGVDVSDQSESESEIKGSSLSSGGGSKDTSEDMVTQYIAYYKNDNGGIGLFSWVGDTVLEDIDDYQARRLRKCVTCGTVEPGPADDTEDYGYDEPWSDTDENRESAMVSAGQQMVDQIQSPEWTGTLPNAEQAEFGGKERRRKAHVCPVCGGSEWKEAAEEYQDVYIPIKTSTGEIPGAVIAADANGKSYRKPTRIPFYKPDRFPIILQRNVSVFGQLLGQSDVDRIADQQNTVNRMEMKIIDRLLKAGTKITLPDRADIRIDPDDASVIYIGNASDKNLIGQYDFTGNLEYEMTYLSQVYEESRQILGITDSYQGRTDNTAQSGKAKQFAAAQSAGRLESKRVMRNAAFADLFQIIFQFMLAYADDPRPVSSTDWRGNDEYSEFNRYDYLAVDDAGEWYWKDQFLFSTDPTDTLANNRERMWEETTNFFQAGAFGNPADANTLIAYWTKMEMLHYPGAGDTRKYMEEQLQKQLAAQQMQMQMQQQAAMNTPTGTGQTSQIQNERSM